MVCSSLSEKLPFDPCSDAPADGATGTPEQDCLIDKLGADNEKLTRPLNLYVEHAETLKTLRDLARNTISKASFTVVESLHRLPRGHRNLGVAFAAIAQKLEK